MNTPAHTHFVAIGGTGMGSLAGLLKARGCRVTGSDQAIYPPMSTALAQWEIPVFEGFRPEHVLESRPDLVVIGNAVRPDNVEARAALDAGMSTLSFPDALYELAISGRHSVVISGTHGKTTTTCLLAHLLYACGCDPSFLVGGISLDFDGSFREGAGEHFVVEGDEYDTVFFDKTPKFLHYHAQTLVVTSVEFDHADIYRDLDHVKSAFRQAVEQMPADGTVVACWDSQDVRDVVSAAPCRVVTYAVASEAGTADGVDWLARGERSDGSGTRFEIARQNGDRLEVSSPLHGRFNVANVLAALATADALGVAPRSAAAALPGFRGIKRRQEVRGEARGVTVVDDFAHHPTAVRGSIQALRARYPDRRLIAVFEPRTNTSRRAVFQQDYARSFDAAHRVIVRSVPATPVYSATGDAGPAFSASQLVEDLRSRGVSAIDLDDVELIVSHLSREARAGDVVLVMSNGAFGNIWEKLLEALKS